MVGTRNAKGPEGFSRRREGCRRGLADWRGGRFDGGVGVDSCGPSDGADGEDGCGFGQRSLWGFE